MFTFGCEIECLLPVGVTHAAAARVISEAGVPCVHEHLSHSTPRSWKVVTDGSLMDYARGAEFVSPPLPGTEEGLAQVHTVCERLESMGCTVTRRCGFHVHVGARNERIDFFKNLVGLYTQFQPVLDSFVPASRRASANPYCQQMRVVDAQALQQATDIRSLQRACGMTQGDRDRYWKLNLAAWYRHGTVEFRHHNGTVNATKAVNWIKLCLAMAAKAKCETTQTTAVAPAALPRTRDRWLATVVDMLCSPNGTTRDEVMARTGERGGRIPRRARLAGLILVRRRHRRLDGTVEVRIYGRRVAAVATTTNATAPITVDGLAQVVGLDVEAHTYFARRAQSLS